MTDEDAEGALLKKLADPLATADLQPSSRRQMPQGKPFKPGQSGNPHGRPKKIRHIPDILARITSERLPPQHRAAIAKLFPEISNRPTFLEAILRIVVQKALKGESWAVEFVAERTEGKVVTPIDLSTGQTMKIVEEIVDVPSD